MNQKPDRLLDVRETCELLGGISKPTFHRLIKTGDLLVVKVGRRTLVDQRDLAAYIERRREASRSRPVA